MNVRMTACRLLLALTAWVLLAEGAWACRGPFSDPGHVKLERYEQAFLGKVLAVGKGAPVNAGMPNAYTPELTIIQVTRTWGKHRAATLIINDVFLAVGGPDCVQLLLPKVGEQWLVVATELPTGEFASSSLKSFPIVGPADDLPDFAAFKKKHGAGRAPGVATPCPAPGSQKQYQAASGPRARSQDTPGCHRAAP
ncbi:hypothetical protein [Massilia sp. TSP1-1-2]|uniref:hypothetical protein n=1 Tax=unclassified Massilia TaxID=2609279 RepID=UPI003CF502A2